MTADLAARLQFAVAAITHGVFSAITVGLITVIAIAQTVALRRGSASMASLVSRWALPYVVVYVLGIVAGMVLELQFGLSWNGLLDRAGNVVGAPLTIETLSTFVVESTLLALWVFGRGVLPPRLHLAVAWGLVGTAMLSEFWALVANSFLQKPQGYAIRSGQLVLTDFAALFAGSTLWVALAHIAGASCLIGGTMVAASSASRLRRAAASPGSGRPESNQPEPGEPGDAEVAALRLGAGVGAVGGVVTIVAGFRSISYLRLIQPAKAAALLGDTSARGAIAGMLRQQYGPGDWLPPGWIVGPAMAMIVIGALVVGVTAWSALTGSPDRPLERAAVLRYLPAAFAGGLFTLVCGWLVREVGRQPWVIRGLVTTAQAAGGVGPLRAVVTLAVVTVLCFGTLAGTVVLVRRVLRDQPALAAAVSADEP